MVGFFDANAWIRGLFSFLTGEPSFIQRTTPDIFTPVETLGGALGEEARENLPGLLAGLSEIGKVALISILGVAGFASVGGVLAANQLSHTRVTIREEVVGVGDTRRLMPKGVEKILGLLALGGLLVGTQFLPKTPGQEPAGLPFFLGGGGGAGGAIASPSSPTGGTFTGGDGTSGGVGTYPTM